MINQKKHTGRQTTCKMETSWHTLQTWHPPRNRLPRRWRPLGCKYGFVLSISKTTISEQYGKNEAIGLILKISYYIDIFYILNKHFFWLIKRMFAIFFWLIKKVFAMFSSTTNITIIYENLYNTNDTQDNINIHTHNQLGPPPSLIKRIVFIGYSCN